MINDTNNEALDSAIVKGFAHVQATNTPVNATEHLAQYGLIVTTTFPEVAAAAAAAFAARVARVIICAVAVLGIGTGVYVYAKATAPASEQPASVSELVPAEIGTSRDSQYVFAPHTAVTFEGGEGAEHINPLVAIASSDQGTIEQWVILDSKGATVMQGEGLSTGNVLSTLPPGEYTVYFSIADGISATAMVQRDFVVQ